MPKRFLTEEVLAEVFGLAKEENLQRLKINAYKSGKNKGRTYADYEAGALPLPETTHRMFGILAERTAKEGMLERFDIQMELNPQGRLTYSIKEKLT